MEFRDIVAGYAALVSSAVAYFQWRATRPKFSIQATHSSGRDRIGFDLFIRNDSDTILNVVDFWHWGRRKYNVAVFAAKDDRDIMEAIADRVDSEDAARVSRFVEPNSAYRFRVSLKAGAPLLLTLVLWERPDWVYPFPLPRLLMLTRRRLADIEADIERRRR